MSDIENAFCNLKKINPVVILGLTGINNLLTSQNNPYIYWVFYFGTINIVNGDSKKGSKNNVNFVKYIVFITANCWHALAEELKY